MDLATSIGGFISAAQVWAYYGLIGAFASGLGVLLLSGMRR